MRLNWDRVISVVGRLPVLQVNALCWVVSTEVTTFRYAFSTTWEPSATWLGFLSGWLTATVTHYYVKRKTDTDHAVAVSGGANGPTKDAP